MSDGWMVCDDGVFFSGFMYMFFWLRLERDGCMGYDYEETWQLATTTQLTLR